MKERHWVLIEPFGPNDFSVHTTERPAVAEYERLRASGKQVGYLVHGGNVTETRITLREYRAKYVAALADETRKVGC
jgi:hypothetical protein